MKQQYLEAGQIVNTHGIRGEVRILPWTDTPDFLRKFKTLYVDGKPMKVLSASVHKQQVIVRFEGIDDINAAMPLKGKTVYIDRADVKLPKGRFFIQDILGAEVVTETGETIGKLTDVLDLPGVAVYEVKGETEQLIPAVPEFVRKVDVEAGVITVHLIDGTCREAHRHSDRVAVQHGGHAGGEHPGPGREEGDHRYPLYPDSGLHGE